MNISSNSSGFSVEEDSSDHEDSSEERAPESGITTTSSGINVSLGSTFDHGSSESRVGWRERGSLTHPTVGFTSLEGSEGHAEGQNLSGGLLSYDGVLVGRIGRLEVDGNGGLGSGCGGLSGVGGVGGVEHSKSGGGLGDTTVDVGSDIDGTANRDLLGPFSTFWLLDPLDFGLNDFSSDNSG